MSFDFVDPGDDLTPEEKVELEKLTEADDGDEKQYKWDEDFQRYVIGMLLNDKVFTTQSRDLVDPQYFTDEVHKLLCRLLFAHFDKYRLMPSRTAIVQELKDAIANKDNKVRVHFISEANIVYDKYVSGLESREYLLDKITNFAKLQALKGAFNSCLGLIKKEPESESTWIKVHNILRDALMVDRNFEPGLDYFQTFEERYARMLEQEKELEYFTSGFESIDKSLLGGGPHRGEIYAWIGMAGSGKSLALVAAALRNVVKGKRVLYVSLEMDEYKIAERFDSQIANVNIGKLQEQKELVRQALQEEISDKEDPRLLIIKQFPAGQMSVPMLRAYLQQCAMIGFQPDLLIIDYIGEMKDYPNMPTWESRYRIVRDLRGLATEEDVCIFTAMQPNKDAREAQKKDGLGSGVIDDTNLADSFGQIRPLDGCWSINQMQAEKEAGIARIFVIKHRHGKSRFDFHVKYDSDTLGMYEISRNQYNEIWKKYTFDQKISETDIDQQTKNIADKKIKAYYPNDAGIEFDPDQPDTKPDQPDVQAAKDKLGLN